MTAIHRLSDAFGGHPVTRIPDADTPFLLCVRVEEEGVGHHILMVPAEMLSPIAPPLPPEPEEGAVVKVGNVVLIRRTFATRGPERCWLATNDEDPWTWQDVCQRDTPVRLVPDPAANAPALPWRVDAVDAVSLLVDRHGVDDAWARDGDAYIQLVAPGAGSVSRRFTAEESRNLAAVLLSAAADTEAGQR